MTPKERRCSVACTLTIMQQLILQEWRAMFLCNCLEKKNSKIEIWKSGNALQTVMRKCTSFKIKKNERLVLKYRPCAAISCHFNVTTRFLMNTGEDKSGICIVKSGTYTIAYLVKANGTIQMAQFSLLFWTDYTLHISAECLREESNCVFVRSPPVYIWGFWGPRGHDEKK